MKKLFLVAISVMALASVQSVSAQWWAGGSLNMWHNTDTNYKSTNLSITPEVGYDVDQQWSIAASVGLSFRSNKYDNSDATTSTVFVLAPYARYKFYNSGIVTLFVDGGIGVAAGDNDGFRIGVNPGMALSITDKISFVTTVGFLGYRNGYYNGTGDGFGLTLSSSSLNFGLYYAF